MSPYFRAGGMPMHAVNHSLPPPYHGPTHGGGVHHGGHMINPVGMTNTVSIIH